jgi:peptide/nickel transport system substrate-binding protein
MRRRLILAIGSAFVLGCAALALGACGHERRTRLDLAPHRGGTLKVLSAVDLDTVDPAASSYATVNTLNESVHRSLYRYAPATGLRLLPDVADGPPAISDGGRTLTIHLRRGVRFAPPVNREVTAADFEYGIERGLLHSVGGTGNVAGALSDVVGVSDVIAGRRDDVPGIAASGAGTLVIKLKRPTAGSVAPALVPPVAIPVPREYAQRFDRGRHSSYGLHQVATGPYRFEADATGTLTKRGYHRGVSAYLVRNPNWDPATDERPAYVDAIDFRMGFSDASIAARQALAGSHTVAVGGLPPRELLRSLAPARLRAVTSPNVADGVLVLTLNTTRPPFSDRRVRQAVAAALDRGSLLKTVGGRTVGRVALHLIPPAVDGFRESGGERGFGTPFARSASGDRTLAQRLLHDAGVDARLAGRIDLLAPDILPDMAEVLRSQLAALGFDVRLRVVKTDAIIALCGDPKRVHACLAGWVLGSIDPAWLFTATLHSRAIAPGATFNLEHLRAPSLDRAIDAAEVAIGAERTRAFAAANRIAVDEAAEIPLVFLHNLIVHSDDVVTGGHYDVDYAATALR